MRDANDIVERVGSVGPLQQLGPGARNRFVVAPGDLASQLPFVLLVEDFIDPGTDFHPHPHKGLETVTFVLSGTLRHGDNVGNRGMIGPGEVQWMTAGKGIVHGGQPAPGAPVHALQLWLALPAALRNSAPGTREQRRDGAIVETSQGATVRAYGTASQSHGAAAWSRWPMTLTDVAFEAGGRCTLPLAAGERAFVYVLSGAVAVGTGPSQAAGSVVWLSVQATDGTIDLSADVPSRLVLYRSPVFDEPIVARGPFVMGSEAEIQLAIHQFQTTGFGGGPPS